MFEDLKVVIYDVLKTTYEISKFSDMERFKEGGYEEYIKSNDVEFENYENYENYLKSVGIGLSENELYQTLKVLDFEVLKTLKYIMNMRKWSDNRVLKTSPEIYEEQLRKLEGKIEFKSKIAEIDYFLVNSRNINSYLRLGFFTIHIQVPDFDRINQINSIFYHLNENEDKFKTKDMKNMVLEIKDFLNYYLDREIKNPIKFLNC